MIFAQIWLTKLQVSACIHRRFSNSLQKQDKLTEEINVSLTVTVQPDNLAKICKLSRTSRSYTFVLIKINVVFEAFAQILRIGILVALNQDSGLVPEHRNHPTE